MDPRHCLIASVCYGLNHTPRSINASTSYFVCTTWVQLFFSRTPTFQLISSHPHNTKMKFLVSADNTGAVKEVICNKGTDTSKKDGKPAISIKNFCKDADVNYKLRITQLVDFQSTYLIAGRIGGKVSIYDLVQPEVPEAEVIQVGEEPIEVEEVKVKQEVQVKQEPTEEAPQDDLYKLLHTYQLDVALDDKPVSVLEISSLDSIIIAFESSKVFLIHFESDGFEYAPIEITLPKHEVTAKYKQEAELDGETQIPVSSHLSCFVKHPQYPGVFAYGGEENDVKIIRLFEEDADFRIFAKEVSFTVETLFTAENVDNDYLDMRVPIWIKQIIFLKSEKPHFKFITGTKLGQLRIYNTAEVSEPVSDYKITNKSIISMVLANDESQEEVILADNHSLVAKHHLKKVDKNGLKIHSASAGTMIRPVAKLMGKYSEGGNTGAIFALENGNNEILVTGGLDRYLRVYDIESRKMLAKVYVAVEISSIVILNTANEKYVPKEGQITRKRRRDIQEAEAGEEEELWAALETSDAKKPTRK